MGKRGPKPKRLVSERWNPNLAYAIGLLATDGCLATGVPLVDLTSKDKIQLQNFNEALGTTFRIGTKKSGAGLSHYRVQIKNTLFYNFLLSIGLTPAKSKTLGLLKIPDKYYFAFLRGVFDGDGYSYSYFDPRWHSSFLFYIGFSSSSPVFIEWIRTMNNKKLSVAGHVSRTKAGHYQLKYAKREAVVLVAELYRARKLLCLPRKRLKISKALGIIGGRLM
jgi:hypothetical protein